MNLEKKYHPLFIEHMKRVLEARKWQQRQLAQKMGFSEAIVSLSLSNKRALSENFISQACQALNITDDDLGQLKEGNIPPVNAEKLQINSDLKTVTIPVTVTPQTALDFFQAAGTNSSLYPNFIFQRLTHFNEGALTNAKFEQSRMLGEFNHSSGVRIELSLSPCVAQDFLSAAKKHNLSTDQLFAQLVLGEMSLP